MSVVEDVRQVLQDFIAPELRAVNTRLDAIESRLSANLDAMSARSDGKFNAINIRLDAMDQRFDDLITIMDTRLGSLGKDVAQVKDMLDIDRRLTRLESKQSQVA
jgi:tetrahydromethanopterin S-methyltransferase subunit G